MHYFFRRFSADSTKKMADCNRFEGDIGNGFSVIEHCNVKQNYPRLLHVKVMD